MANAHGVIDVELIENQLSEILQNHDIFYKPQLENSTKIKKLCQKSYSAAVSDGHFKGKALSKLLIDGFDEEQIWQQSDLLNRTSSSILSDYIHKFDSKDFLSVLNDSFSSESPFMKKVSKTSDNQEDNQDAADFSSQDSSAEDDYAFDDDSDSATEFDTKLNRDQLSLKNTEYASDVDSDFDGVSNSNKQLKKEQPPKKKSEYTANYNNNSKSDTELGENLKEKQLPQKKSEYTSVVDDQFFKLSNLENFLRIEDLKEERGEDSASDDDDIDLFQDIPSDDLDVTDNESGDEEDKTKKSARDLMYEDFFDDPESELENKSSNALIDGNENLNGENDEYSFDESEPDVEMETGNRKENEQNKMTANSINSEDDKKTKFELEQEKIQRKILEYEKSMLQPLPWHLTGEVAADKRPVDSLLEQEAEFDCNTKQDLLVDKDLTEKIEEITIMAIRNKAYFDVERKYKPTEDIINYKKEVALEQTKSKKSLAEVYAEDYLKRQNKQDAEEEEDPKHKEIKKVMGSLLPQLHALFSHIPKPAIPEIKIVSNLPAITVEEVAPTNVSDATLLAPEEVKQKTGLVKSKTERTDTDRKRERRKKKIHQRLKEKKKLQKLESQKENPSAKVSKLEKVQALKKLKQHKNTKLATVDESGKIKSSKDFFSRLQDTMDVKNKIKTSGKKVKNK